MKKYIWLILLLIIVTAGCSAPPSQLKISRFKPITAANTKVVMFDKEAYGVYEDAKYKVMVVLYEYNAVMAMYIEITDKTGTNISVKDYSISLNDGRDLKALKTLTREDLIAAKAKLEQKSSGSNIVDQATAAIINAITSKLDLDSKNYLISTIGKAIDNYYAFRPIFKNETRKGILCFLVDFKLEYPLTLITKIKGEEIKIKFMPVI